MSTSSLKMQGRLSGPASPLSGLSKASMALITAVLAACGGGGDDNDTSSVQTQSNTVGGLSDAKSDNGRPIVETQSGTVQGLSDGKSVKFLGIPYAKPPVGKLRWANPVRPDPWSGVRDATQYGKICAQLQIPGDFSSVFSAASTDEDCLYLNVFAPKNAQKRPVMVWIHGGGRSGGSNEHDGSALVKEQNAVVVTINFRLGAFGSLVHPAVDGGGTTTLYYLRDQQFALQWVRNNIEKFGGDPDNVTIFGESRGGVDTLLHMISPTAKGLFHRAILQSGVSRYFNRLVPLVQAEERGKAFATAIGCPDQSADCLRNASVDAILEAYRLSSWDGLHPINDGHVITSSVSDAIRSGQFNRVPVLSVNTHDEWRWFQAFTEITTGHVITSDEYPAQLAASFGTDAPAVAAAYPLSDFDSPSGALASAVGDRLWLCQAHNFSVDASKYVPVWAAEFNDPNSPGILPKVSFPLLASHTHEIQYIFPGWKGAFEGEVTPLTQQQEKLAKNMRRIWGTFAEKGGLPTWPRVTRDEQPVISLEIPHIRVITDFSEDHRCNLWSSIRNWTPVQ